MIKKITYQGANDPVVNSLVAWEPSFDESVEQTVTTIIRQIRQLGDVALVDYTRQLDRNNVDSAKALSIAQDDLVAAWESITDEERQALHIAKQRINDYAEQQKIDSWTITDDHGSLLGQQVSALDSVGLYVPGGTAAYPSSVLMNAIPAKVAGVKRLVMVSPAMDGQLNPLVLAAAFLCEVDEFYTIGGAQAVAALAYGTQQIAAVDKIVGPGNIYVATAKKQVFGKVAIDMVAGPSEIVVISDGSANPRWIAADLLSQAEHDTNAQAILITNNAKHAEAVEAAIADILTTLPRKEIAETSLAQRGAIVLTDDLSQCVVAAQQIAPEHLEILTTNAEELAKQITHAGAIFIGTHSCEALGDYVAGPNHVLPTSGTARFSSPLGVYDFQKRSSIIYCQPSTASELAQHAKVLATSEGLHAHALSAELRINAGNHDGDNDQAKEATS